MPEYLAHFAQHYGLLTIGSLAILKFLHLILYRGFNTVYIVSHFFKIYDREELSAKLRNRRTFRRWHNLFTYPFYCILTLWVIYFFLEGSR